MITGGYEPHGHCYLWSPWLIALHATSDALIWTAYIWIPLSLIMLTTRVGLVQQVGTVYRWLRTGTTPPALTQLLWWFAAFIASCGLTHGVEILVIVVPAYWEQGAIKLLCAGISIRAAFLMARVTFAVATAAERIDENDGWDAP
jgi:hypothetical protein